MDVFIGEEVWSGDGVSGAVQPQMRMNTIIMHGEKIRRIFINLISPAGQRYLMKPIEVSGT
jgi:hypothetical protein